VKGFHLWFNVFYFVLAFAVLGAMAAVEWGWIDRSYSGAVLIWCVTHWKTLIVLFVVVGTCGQLLDDERRKQGNRPPPPGLCRKCGYDLRGTPDRCPECGTLTRA